MNSSYKVGVNLNPASEFADFTILQENSNSMSFDDNIFGVVLSNVTLEHDKYFWKTLEEIRRITKPGGLIVIGVPGYRFYKLEKFKSRMRKQKWLKKLHMHPKFNMFFCSTITFEGHDYLGDFFRFTEQAVEEVILDGLEKKSFTSVMLPPRIIGSGVLPSNT